MSAPTRLAPRALYEEVAERLRQRIFQGELSPGDWIDEVRLAADYGISRTPMREALKVLAAEGLVTIKVRRGAYVTEMSEQDLAAAYHVLALLEADAAAAVARQASDDALAELQALHAELSAAQTDQERFFQLNEHYHLRLLSLAGNRWREQMALDLRKVMKLARHASLNRAGRMAAATAEHAALMQALARRDAAAAAQAMQAHFSSSLQAVTPVPESQKP